jgi:hypothetical protein
VHHRFAPLWLKWEEVAALETLRREESVKWRRELPAEQLQRLDDLYAELDAAGFFLPPCERCKKHPRGVRGRYCSTRCRVQAHRERQRQAEWDAAETP